MVANPWSICNIWWLIHWSICNRVANPLEYFLCELLCVPKDQLVDVKEVPLKVMTLSCEQSDLGPPNSKQTKLAPLVSPGTPWILDIDLDCFSTGNPFRGPFTDVRAHTFIVALHSIAQEEFHLLKQLYKVPLIMDSEMVTNFTLCLNNG